MPTHTYAECKISGQQPTQLHKEFHRIHNAGHSKENDAQFLKSKPMVKLNLENRFMIGNPNHLWDQKSLIKLCPSHLFAELGWRSRLHGVSCGSTRISALELVVIIVRHFYDSSRKNGKVPHCHTITKFHKFPAIMWVLWSFGCLVFILLLVQTKISREFKSCFCPQNVKYKADSRPSLHWKLEFAICISSTTSSIPFSPPVL